MTARKQRQRDALAALSLANLSFVRTWNEILFYTRDQSFFFRNIPGLSQSFAAVLNVLALTVVLYGVIRLMRFISRRKGDGWALILAPILVIPPANSISGIIAAVAPNFAPQTWWRGADEKSIAAFVVVALVGIFVASKWPDWILRIAAFIAVNFALLFPAEIALVGWHHFTDQKQDYIAPIAGPLPDTKTTAIVWIIFDEMAYRILFQDHPKDVQIPEFERLRNEAISADNALTPSRKTYTSIPSILVGRRFQEVDHPTPSQMIGIPASGAPKMPIVSSETVFGTARSLGINIGVAGWYLPYCRAFADVMSACSWYDLGRRLNVEGKSLWEDFLTQAKAPYETATFSPFPMSGLQAHRKFNAEGIEKDSLALLARPNPGFVYIHHMATHDPYIFDRKTGAFTLRANPRSGYYDALVWADVMLGKFRRTMEKAGYWDRAMVIVSSDHAFRESQTLDGKVSIRVPWIVKMPGHNERITYMPQMHTIVTRKILEAFMRNEISTQKDALTWLQKNEARVFAESER